MNRRPLAGLIGSALLLAPAHLAAQTAKDPVPLPNPSLVSPPEVSTEPVKSAAAPTSRAGSIDTVSIGGIGAAKGAVTINAASGVFNQQLNAGAIASGPTALIVGSIFQFSEASGQAGGDAHATIAPGTLAGSSGWLAVSGVAGSDNQQANLAFVALGTEGAAMSDTLLGQVRTSTKPMGENGAADASPSRTVAIGQGAFRGSSGVVQLSLVGGDRNSSANTFALLVAGTAKPE